MGVGDELSVPFGTSQRLRNANGNSRFTAGRTRVLRFSFGKVAVLKKFRVLGQLCDSVFIL